MCFEIDRKHKEKKVAKRNITCYKVFFMIDDELASPCQDFTYELNKTYKGDIRITIEDKEYIDIGFHSYSSIKGVDDTWLTYDVTYKCQIPKGSEYYYNSEYKEYVSNQLIVKEKL